MEAKDFEIHGHVQLQPEVAHDSDDGQTFKRTSRKDSAAEKDMVKDGSRLEASFKRAMCHEFQIADRYTDVGALIISWADDLDDLKCGAEVCYSRSLYCCS